MMKPRQNLSRLRSSSAFTMIEIAISLAVIAFALVAIIGVMPSGMQVQRDNREETIINQEAGVFASAIRNGARGMDDLTNYVFAITNFWTLYDVTPTITNNPRPGYDGFDWYGSEINGSPAPFFPLINGSRIIGLLGHPKYEPIPGGFRSNYICAYVRAMSGLASEKAPQTNEDVGLGAFSYRMLCENMQTPQFDSGVVANGDPFVKQLTNNLHDLRLSFRWPLKPNNELGNGRQTFRTAIGGRLFQTNDIGVPLYFFEPQTFATAP